MRVFKVICGTHIEMSDGKRATVVQNSLIGVGIKWGLHSVTLDDLTTKPQRWKPDALLRDYWQGCEKFGFSSTTCVGKKYKRLSIVRNGTEPPESRCR